MNFTFWKMKILIQEIAKSGNRGIIPILLLFHLIRELCFLRNTTYFLFVCGKLANFAGRTIMSFSHYAYKEF
jgi:hypothetical protein